MKITYFHRHPSCGFSIQRVFKTLQQEIGKTAELSSFSMPFAGARPWDLISNGLYARFKNKRECINHISGSEHYLILFLLFKKTIVTVHDVMYIEYLTGIKRFIWKQVYIKPLKYANKVTFISEEAKNKTLQHVNLSETKFQVIPNPVSTEMTYSAKKFNAIKPLILHIGTLERKNILRSIKALKGISCHLRIIGKLNKKVLESLQENQIEFSNGINLTDQEIIQEYKNCDIVNFVSLLEGFGMPIVEGQAIGRLVITSNLSPMKEVAANGAFLVNPYDTNEIRNAYKKIISDQKLRKEIVANGLQNVKKYKLKTVAQQYLDLYKSIG